jgi:hypothetical protein
VALGLADLREEALEELVLVDLRRPHRGDEEKELGRGRCVLAVGVWARSAFGSGRTTTRRQQSVAQREMMGCESVAERTVQIRCARKVPGPLRSFARRLIGRCDASRHGLISREIEKWADFRDIVRHISEALG